MKTWRFVLVVVIGVVFGWPASLAVGKEPMPTSTPTAALTSTPTALPRPQRTPVPLITSTPDHLTPTPMPRRVTIQIQPNATDGAKLWEWFGFLCRWYSEQVVCWFSSE